MKEVEETKKTVAAISVADAGTMLGVSGGTIRDMIREGRLPHIRLGRRIVIPKIAIDKIITDALGVELEAPYCKARAIKEVEESMSIAKDNKDADAYIKGVEIKCMLAGLIPWRSETNETTTINSNNKTGENQ